MKKGSLSASLVDCQAGRRQKHQMGAQSSGWYSNVYHLFAQRLGSYSTLTAQDLLAQVTAIRQADNLPTASICKEGHDTSWQGKVLHLSNFA